MEEIIMTAIIKYKKHGLQAVVILVLITAVLLPVVKPVSAYTGIPTFSIVTVVTDTSVTIKTNNFPADETFTVRMGPFGTLGIGGTVVGTTDSGTGGSFQATYDIPASLAGSYKIAIRMDSANGYYAYNWFYNKAASEVQPGYTGIPTFSIVSVVVDSSVTIKTNNFPADLDFTVRMGPIGTKAIGGIVVATTNSGTGGSFEATYDIPDSLKGSYQIAIRMDSPTGFYFAYNWFYNNTTAVTPPSGYTGIPTFSIVSAVEDTSVTIKTNNFPPDQDFTVRMGAFGTRAIGGEVVATTNSGTGGSFEKTYDIPADLAGSYKIAIRMDSPEGYFAYNWFYNNTAAAPTSGYTGIPTFSIIGVSKDISVTIKTTNFPADQEFTVRMGLMGTKAVDGIVVGTTDSGTGGSLEATYNIPASLAGETQIAIRMDSANGIFFSYNWFYNTNYP
jgi:hypothetical protein